MNCPGCNKILASSLSVCWSCGTMMNDSVREELAMKISPLAKSAQPEIKKEISKPSFQPSPIPPPIQSTAIHTSLEPKVQIEATEPIAVPPIPVKNVPVEPIAVETAVVQAPVQPRAPVAPKAQTAEIAAKQTSPTLVEFRHKNAVVPEWRLQLQNAVRKRQDHRDHSHADVVSQTVTATAAAQQPMTLATSGATALQAEPTVQNNPNVSDNPKLEAALRRIEQSRQMFYAEEKPKTHLTAVPQTPPPPKNFPYAVAPQTMEAPPLLKEEKSTLKASPRTFIIEKKAEKFDTNKLPPLSQLTKTSLPTENRSFTFKAAETKIEIDETNEKLVDETAEAIAYGEVETIEQTAGEFEEIDDCAPVSLRFNAGLFDLIIGSFLSFVLLSPFMLLNGNLFTFQGLLAFLATCSIVMFVYLTTTIGFLGRTFGMRLFALEIIDIEENEYPTFHQAAVNSCVYLFSLALGGIGFLPLFFNSERRAAHDLLAGTIVVREEV